jgi:hypothetical protein
MTLLTILVMLLVAGVIIYAVKLAFAGNWQQLVITIIVLLLVIWILGAFGISLPVIGK